MRHPCTPLAALVLAAITLVAIDACKRPQAPPSPEAAAAADSADAGSIARIDAAAAATVGIATAKAAAAEISETLSLFGVVKLNAERVREVIARFPGTVRSVSRSLGDTVRKGQTLATIESNESLQTYAVTAPISGTVTTRDADPGEQAGNEVLFTIADLSSVWVELSLFPADAARVHRGQRVTVTSVGGDLAGDGRIGLVGVFGGGAEPTARVPLDNPGHRWTPGLFVNGTVELSKVQVPVAVAASALQTLDDRRVVFVPVAGGYAARAVKTGRSDAQFVEILDGLRAGETYVSVNSFVVKAEIGKSALEGDDDEPSAGKAADPAQ